MRLSSMCFMQQMDFNLTEDVFGQEEEDNFCLPPIPSSHCRPQTTLYAVPGGLLSFQSKIWGDIIDWRRSRRQESHTLQMELPSIYRHFKDPTRGSLAVHNRREGMGSGGDATASQCPLPQKILARGLLPIILH